ncbi:MAG: cofactor-independent phosphoglycerate mutase [Clostridia bacterium]|nr:cofactor-independent phosphoglycerate mutase [Clostridia bacterium]
MKYVVILGDGMADYPSKALGGRTPLEVADKPNIDDLCKRGKLGLVKTVPDGMKPGSDVANLSMMGYAPDKYYTGRSPLEALSIGIDLKDTDVAIRCNLVTLSDEESYGDKTMVDYSAGEISTEEAKQLIEYLQQNLGDEYIDFHAGVSYRHCLVAHNAETGTDFTPPHDISDKKITPYLPKGEYGDIFLDIMTDSYNLLKDHPINKKRIEQGLNPANSIWLWGEGTRPQLTPFEEKYGIKGAVISAVDLIKGIGTGAQMKVIEVEGATGTYKTNFEGKAEAAIEALKEGYDYVYIHMEAPDECGHQGDVDNKVKSIELIDGIVVKYVKEQLDLMNEDYKILIAPDHPTPLSLKTHTSDPVPFIIYSHKAGEEQSPATGASYSEENGKDAGLFFSTGEELMEEFLHGEISSVPNESSDSDESVEESGKDESSDGDGKKDKDKEDKKDKQDKPVGQKKKLSKKGVIAIVASVCLVGVLLAIILPIVFFHAPRIFVKNADDFVASKQGGLDQYFYVLDNNVSCDNLTFDDNNIYSIDLNKHTLSVSDTLKITSTKSGTLYIGTRKGKGYVTHKKSNLKAGSIEIDAPNLDVVLLANVSCETLRATAKSLTIYNFEGGETNIIDAEISAEKVVFAGNIIDAKSTSQINVLNCPDTIVESGVKISNTISLVGSNLTVKSGSAVATLQLDDDSTAKIAGSITNTVIGGKQVIMQEGHSCPTYQNVKNLIIFRDLNSTHNMTGCENVIYVEKLAQPIDIIIEERENRIYCKVAKVKYAKAYKFVVSDGNPENDVTLPLWEKNTYEDPEYDITQYVSTPGKSYTITVTPLGDYSDDLDFEEIGSTTMYVSGDSISVQYDYIITLNMPTGLKVYTTKEDENTTKTYFEFLKVADADSYKIYVDNQEIANPALNADGDKISVDITQYVNKVGDHSVRVKAINTQNPNIKDSPISMIAHSTIQKLTAVEEDTITATISEDDGSEESKSAAIHASWQGVQNGYEYLVELQINGGEKIEIGRTSILTDGSVGYSINFNDLKELYGIEYDSEIAANGGYSIIVTAIGHGYYTDSDTAQCIATLTQSPTGSENGGAINSGNVNNSGFTSGIDSSTVSKAA